MYEKVISKRMNFLRKVPLFAAFREEDLRALSEAFHARHYRKKEIIFYQEDDTHDFNLIMSGKVRIFCYSPSGNETTIRVLVPHEMLGEFASIDEHPRSTTAQAITDCTLLRLRQERFSRYLREMPDFATTMLRLLVQKLRWTTEYAEAMAQYDIGGRLLHVILYYNTKIGREIEKNKCYEVKLGLNQGDLSSMVGARREWVNRLFCQWRKQGLVTLSHGTINILDLPAVEAERDRRIGSFSENDRW
ncbi:MAG: Crp/Fnr family transcriptional regulator [Deltaproteobacteria bacterium]|nr:Crp/Fnr family transcriptional regulator [Deltaproteobacteria bacterium]